VISILFSVIFAFGQNQSIEEEFERIEDVSEITFAEQFIAGERILEIRTIEDFIEFQRLRVNRGRSRGATFAGREIHLLTDLMVFDTTGSNTWSRASRPTDFDSVRRRFYLHRGLSQFSGVFDGNGHYIRGLYGVSFFGAELRNAVVRNLNISHSFFTAASIARHTENSTIDNVNVSATNVIGGGAGGIVRHALKKTRITNSSFSGNIEGSSMSSTGGIVSVARHSTTLLNNTVSGTVSGRAGKTSEVGFNTPSSAVINNNTDNVIFVERPRIFFMSEGNFSFGLGDYGISSGGGNLISGAVINRHFALGLGVGFNITLVQTNDGIDRLRWRQSGLVVVDEDRVRWDEGEILYRYHHHILTPVFLRSRFYLVEGHISPIIDADAGIAIVYSMWSSDTDEISIYPSFYFNPSFGIAFGRAYVSLGYKLWVAEYERLVRSGEFDSLDREFLDKIGTKRKASHSLSLRAGVYVGWGSR